jgi:hypothetical protein
LGAGVFFAAGNAVGRGAGALEGAAGRDVDAVDVVPGSVVIMLTAGVEAALGNSALVGLPVGTPGMSAATGAVAGVVDAFQAGE